MKKFLLQLLPVVILIFAAAMMAQEQTTGPARIRTNGPTQSCVDAWSATSTNNAPTPRERHTAVWTGGEMIVWGGNNISTEMNSGGRYDPGLDSWTATITTNAPIARYGHTAVWTGSEMIVWGGFDGSAVLSTGGRYNPSTNTWTATTTTNAPSARSSHTAVWTGSEMIVWGGQDNITALNSGGRYNPSTDTWTTMSTTAAPAGRWLFPVVWTGSEMIVWGGYDNTNDLNTGGRYNPSTNSWTATSTANAPAERESHTAVWTGSEMIVWGGLFAGGVVQHLNTGGRYNPSTDTWTATSTASPPTGRAFHSVVWTGSEMIVWGGGYPSHVNTGGRYNPDTDVWAVTTTNNAPTNRSFQTAVWTGNQMIVWGGMNNQLQGVNTGGRYCSQPTTNPTPTPTPSPTPPATPTPTPTPPHTPTPTPTTDPTATATATPTTPPPTPTPTIPPAPSPTPTPFGNTCGWSSAPAYPVETFGGGITSLGDYIYSFGGDTSASVTKAYKFDGVSWTALAPLPFPEAFPSAVNDGTNIYLVGTTVHKYDPVANTYASLAQYNVGTSGHRSVYLGGKIYKICGVVPGPQFPIGSNALEIYDIATDTWTNGADVPYAAASVNAFTFGNYVYIAGGMLSPPSPVNNAYRYDPSTNTWDNSIPFLPEARTGSAVAVYENGVVLADGANQSFQILDSALFWDATSNQWLNLPATLTPSWDGMGAVLNGSFYLVGGRTDSTANGSTTNQKLSCTSIPTPTPTPHTPTPTPTATPAVTPIFGNISTRLRVEFGADVLIGGFIVTGTQPKKVIIRAIGPSLPFPGVLANPYLELRDSSGTLIRANNNWRDEQEAQIIATTIPPSNDLESAIVETLPANGAAYTAAVSGMNIGTGIGMVEVYDLDQAAHSKLANISTRGLVQTGDDVMIAGMIVLGQTNTMRVILRAIGPSLPVPGALADPMLELRDGNGGLVAANDNWRRDQEAEIIATTIAPTNDLESAIVRNLPPGNYTGIVSGVGNTTGVGLVEAYNLSN